jgi:hypothetical protein
MHAPFVHVALVAPGLDWGDVVGFVRFIGGEYRATMSALAGADVADFARCAQTAALMHSVGDMRCWEPTSGGMVCRVHQSDPALTVPDFVPAWLLDEAG